MANIVGLIRKFKKHEPIDWDSVTPCSVCGRLMVMSYNPIGIPVAGNMHLLRWECFGCENWLGGQGATDSVPGLHNRAEYWRKVNRLDSEGLSMVTMQELADVAEKAPGWGKALFDLSANDYPNTPSLSHIHEIRSELYPSTFQDHVEELKLALWRLWLAIWRR